MVRIFLRRCLFSFFLTVVTFWTILHFWTRFSTHLERNQEELFISHRIITDQPHHNTKNLILEGEYNIYDHYNESHWRYCDNSTRYEICAAENKILQAPTAVSIGVMKSGTTALDFFMDLHPDITVNARESGYFGMETEDRDSVWKKFCDRFPCKDRPSGVVVERSPHYFKQTISASAIYERNRNMKLLLIIREPVERVMSNLVHACLGKCTNWGNLTKWIMEKKNPSQLMYDNDIIQYSNYYRYLPSWLEYFEVNKTLLVIDHHRFTHDLYKELYRIESFLELPHKIQPDQIMRNTDRNLFCKNFEDRNARNCMGLHKGRRHIRMPPDVYRELKIYFKESNEQFFKAIGQDLGWNNYFKLSEQQQKNTSNV